MRNKKFAKYFREYEVSNISAMLRNNRLDPKIHTGDFKNRLVVISGATSGIGYYTARKYASHGADLLCISCTGDEGRSFGVGFQERASNHSKLPRSKAVGGERWSQSVGEVPRAGKGQRDERK